MERIGIIGTGNMGEAIIRALLETGFEKERIGFSEISKLKSKYIKEKYSIKEYALLKELTDFSKYLVIAVKPQDAKDVLKNLTSHIRDKHVILSIMAGVSISAILSIIGQGTKVIRAMPNLCVKVREGVIGICRNEIVGDDEFEYVKKLFSGMGMVVEIKEELFDAITAFAGSGPAFFLFFLEGMIDAGVKLGFSRQITLEMAEKILSGTLTLLKSEATHPSILKERITSPGGTTIAGLTELEDRAVKGAVIKAFEVACRRSKELSQ
ncbi:MAG: pyrroline-5-carboxylate reductase [Deltaproteobacteria bacterium]|nr:pyrroline-5-carboxylate reductase [Deltaproteobacteria bacterium]